MKTKDIAKIIVNSIIADLTDRRGLRQEWEYIDSEIQNEIEKTWIEIVQKVLKENNL